MRISVVILLAVLAAGCGRQPARPPAGNPPSPGKANPPGAPLPVATNAAPAEAGQNVSAPRAVPFTVFARFGTADDPSVALVDKKTKRGLRLRRGEAYSGYELRSVDFEKDEAVFTLAGAEVRVPITRAVAPVAGTAPTMAEAKDLPVPDLATEHVEHFEPTAAERTAGIDPNDEKTWPPGYRGPGIERALAGVAPMGMQTPAVRTNANDYMATQSESSRGIDPNNSATWPADYKGPGIERAMQASPGVAQQGGPTLQAQPDNAPPAQGMGPGIEQALREQQGQGR
jgi:hypothetical protein